MRISGAATGEILRQLTVDCDGASDEADIRARRARLLAAKRATCQRLPCDLGWGGRTVDANVYFWPNARSFTGQPCAELHLIGSPPVVEALIERIVALGANPAERGEFTLRSFLAGKLDLAQAEAVLGVIEADGEEELERALGMLGGNLSRPVGQLRSQLIELLAHLEAGLDFVEEDIEFIGASELLSQLEEIRSKLAEIAQRLTYRTTRSRLPAIVLAGLPNAGKSTLFNALLGMDRAIVTSEAGTTRDSLVATLELAGTRIELVDTAGMEEIRDASPRALAQNAVGQTLADADLVLLCVDLQSPEGFEGVEVLRDHLRTSGLAYRMVGCKADGLGRPSTSRCVEVDRAVCALQAESVDAFRVWLRREIGRLQGDSHSDAMHRATVRCRTGMERACEAIDRAIELEHARAGEELVATELRCALDDLSAVVGQVHSDDILGEIFSRFCIGK